MVGGYRLVARHRKNGPSGGNETREQDLSITWEQRPARPERHNTAFVVGALIGGVAGSTAALFRTPQAGYQTREQLASYVGMASQRINDLGARLRLGADQGAGSLRSRAGALGSRTRVDLRPATSWTNDARPVETRPVNVDPAMPIATAPSNDPGMQEADPIIGLDPALALTPGLAGTGTATTSVGPEVADEERVLGDDVPPNVDR